MIETIIITLIVCKIKGYKVSKLLKDKAFCPVIIMELVCGIIQINIFLENYWIIEFSNILKTVYLCSYLPLVFKYRQYISAIIGSILMLIGGVLNNIAIKANDGFMPVFPTLSYLTGYVKIDSFEKVNDIHVLGSNSTKLKYLTDIFDIGYGVLSVGDIFIRAFIFIILYSVVVVVNKDKIIKED